MADGNKSLQLPPYPAQAAPGDYVWVDWWRRLQQFMKDLINEINKSTIYMGPANWELLGYFVTVTKNILDGSGTIINTVSVSYPITAGAWTVTQGQFSMGLIADISVETNEQVIDISMSVGTATTDGGQLYAVPPPAGLAFLGFLACYATVGANTIISRGTGLGWDNPTSTIKSMSFEISSFQGGGDLHLLMQATYPIEVT